MNAHDARIDDSTSLYVHVPFCAARCSYCDFHSNAGPLSSDGARAFVDGILSEIDSFDPVLDDVPTIYVGGGTPTMLGAELPRLVGALRSRAGVRPDAEVTIEANPDSLTPELVHRLAESGATRVSLGVQSFDDVILARLGRVHDAVSAVAAAESVRAAGLRLSIDVMCGVPGQDDRSVRTSVETAAGLAGHVSVYPLTVEEGTPLAAAIESGRMGDPDPDDAAHQMEIAEDELAARGLIRYEVANFARVGERSIHNTRYWTGRCYVGVGPSAASMLSARRARLTSAAHLLGPDVHEECRVRFVASDLPDGLEVLMPAEAVREDAMLGLRLTRGITDELAAAAAVTTVLGALAGDGLVSHEAGRWKTTHRGWLLGNEVFGRVWAGE